MTGTDIHEALHAVADATAAPPPDRLELQRHVRRERRSFLGARAALGAAVAAAVAVAGVAAVPLLGEPGGSGAVPAATPPVARVGESGPMDVDLENPLYFLTGGRLTALTPQGETYDLGLPAEEVVGWTSEFVLALDTAGEVVRFDVANSDEGPGGPWTFERVDAEAPEGPGSVRLSADGRWLGWIDRDGHLTVKDLLAGTVTGPTDLPDNSYLVDVAQGTGAPLVSEDGDLVLHTADGEVEVPTANDGYGWASTASRDLVAVMDRDETTRVYDVSGGKAELVDEVRGAGRLSPYGTHVASVAREGGGAGATLLLWAPGQETLRLPTPGTPMEVAWADDDTFVLTSRVDGQTVVVGCEALDPACSVLPVEDADEVGLAH